MGGWTGIQEGIGGYDEKLADQILNIGSEYVHRKGVEDLSPEQLERKLLLGGQYDEQQLAVIYQTPAWLVSLTLIIVGFVFATVNHTQSMRLFGARSMWHLKMSVVPACLILLFVTFVNFKMGIMGKSIYPDITLLPVEPALQKNRCHLCRIGPRLHNRWAQGCSGCWSVRCVIFHVRLYRFSLVSAHY